MAKTAIRKAEDMAINRKKDEGAKGLPSRLADMLLRGFTFQALRDKYDGAFKDAKGEVVGYLEKNDDDFNVDLGKGFKCDQGTVIYTSRSNWSFDKDKIIGLVKSKTITIETLINMASFRAEDLKTAIGEEAFKGLATLSTSESLTFRATPEFKSTVDEKFETIEPSEKKPVDLTELGPTKSKLPAGPLALGMHEEAKKSAARVKAAAAKKAPAKKGKKDADEELDEILKKSGT